MLGQLFWMLDVTDVVVTLVCNHWMLLADVICHVVVLWLMFFATVTDVITTFVCLWKMKTTFE